MIIIVSDYEIQHLGETIPEDWAPCRRGRWQGNVGELLPTDPTQVEEDDNDGKSLKHIQQCVVDQKLVSEYRFGQVGREVLQ